MPHTDAGYMHQPGEVNLWIPVVPRVSESNSLYCESAEGAADFAAFAMDYGQFVRFYANRLRHYTVLNTTEFTRVSIDIRLIAGPVFIPRWLSPLKDWAPFTLGGYYREIALEDAAVEPVGGGSSGEPEPAT